MTQNVTAILKQVVRKHSHQTLMIASQNRFFDFARDKFNRIEEFASNDLALHRKVLYVTYIDSLSALVYPAYRQNRSRFTEFVIKFGNWANAERVCTPHLARALSLNPDPAYDKIRALVHEKLSAWRLCSHVEISADLEASVVGTHWPSGKHYEQLMHVELLYAFRNSLVHDFRQLGPGYDLPEDHDPYYTTTHTVSGEDKTGSFHWELVYPEAFLRHLADTALLATETHVCANQINPADVLKTGKYWVTALNR